MIKNIKDIQKLSFATNTVILSLVVLMMLVYSLIGAMFLVYYSIFVCVVYLAHYLFIRKNQFIKATWSIYAMMTIYMAVCTIYLGYDYGFQLYSLSTIPLIYYIKYMQTKYGGEDPRPNLCSAIIVIVCLLSSLYSVKNGPIYRVEGIPTLVFLGINLTSVCCFLIGFAKLTTGIIIESEKKLQFQANYDALTKLSNRFNMRTILQKSIEEKDSSSQLWIAMLDIDNFKKINDKYGHAAGDRVLVKLAEIMKKICKDCAISRWGGEEFLICGKNDPKNILESLVKEVERTPVKEDCGDIHFTISVGASNYAPGDRYDTWIIRADKLLYKAKENGKNQVMS